MTVFKQKEVNDWERCQSSNKDGKTQGKQKQEHVSGVLLPVWRTLVGSGKPQGLALRWDLDDTERVCHHQRRPY